MWMLCGGIDGNGAMINFDKGVLSKAMSQGGYEFGRFGAYYKCIYQYKC